MSWSTISNNVGYGFALWLNETTINYPIHQETVVAYSNISLNYDIGVLVGNFCGPAVVNISGNHFVFGRYIGMSLIFRKILQNLSYFWNEITHLFVCLLQVWKSYHVGGIQNWRVYPMAIWNCKLVTIIFNTTKLWLLD